MKSILIIAPPTGLVWTFGQECKEKYDVRYAADGERGAGLYSKRKADLVLLDVDPEDDFVATLMQLGPDAAVFAFAKESSSDRLKRASAAGAVRTFVKGIRLRDLVTAIDEHFCGDRTKGS